MYKPNLLLLNYEDVVLLKNDLYVEFIEAVTNAYLWLDSGQVKNPASTLLWYDKKLKKRVIALPACIDGNKKIIGIKWISSVPENVANHLPRASALLILNDEATGFPEVILEGAQISAIRTVLSSIVALGKLCSKKNIRRLGVVGAGYITENFIFALLKLGWGIENIYVFDLVATQGKKLKDNFSELNIHICDSEEQVFLKADVIFLATTAVESYICNESLLQKQIILNISLRDLSPAFILKSNNIVDNLEHILSSDTSVRVAYDQSGSNISFVNGTISDLIKGTICLDVAKPTIVSPMGLGILDIAVGELIYKHAVARNVGTTINNFFGY